MKAYTNYEKMSSMPEIERANCMQVYKRHPLYNYINWEEFWKSTDGNEMHFLQYLDKFIDKDQNTNIVLELYNTNGNKMGKIYICEKNKIVNKKI